MDAKVSRLDELLRRCHAPGIYFGMSADEYHKDPSLGSTNIKMLRRNPRRYQKNSWMNPSYVPTETKATIVGTALHMIVLEGVEKFSQHYVRRPASYNDLSQSEKTAMTKGMKAKLAANQELLSNEDYLLCIEAAQEIVDHDDMRKSLQGGLNEVSFFWRDRATGVPCKGRADRLKARGIGDLKSIANENELPLEIAAGFAIKRYRYDIQAAHYLTGIREALKGSVFGAGAAATALVEQTKTNIAHGDFGYQLIFIQKGDADVWSCVWSPENPTIRVATDHAHWAIEMFKAKFDAYGTARWAASWRLGELHAEDIPGGEHGWY